MRRAEVRAASSSFGFASTFASSTASALASSTFAASPAAAAPAAASSYSELPPSAAHANRHVRCDELMHAPRTYQARRRLTPPSLATGHVEARHAVGAAAARRRRRGRGWRPVRSPWCWTRARGRRSVERRRADSEGIVWARPAEGGETSGKGRAKLGDALGKGGAHVLVETHVPRSDPSNVLAASGHVWADLLVA